MSMKTNFVVMCANDEEARHVMRLLKTYSFSRGDTDRFLHIESSLHK
jgi:hypothetical protein